MRYEKFLKGGLLFVGVWTLVAALTVVVEPLGRIPWEVFSAGVAAFETLGGLIAMKVLTE